jgi:structural maintenance of chromosome 1
MKKQRSSKVVHVHMSINVQISNKQVLISHVQDLRPAEKEKLEMEFKGKMEFISLEVERTAPNLKALDQYESLREKEKESIEEFDAARKASKEIADKYNAIKQQR